MRAPRYWRMRADYYRIAHLKQQVIEQNEADAEASEAQETVWVEVRKEQAREKVLNDIRY